MRYIDTSIPLCVMTGEPRELYSRCVEIMGRVERGEEKVSTSVLTVAEIKFILEGREKLNDRKATDMVLSFLDCLGLKLLDVEAGACREAVEISAKFGLDFVDAYNVLTMRRNGIKEIYSLDGHYDIFKDIQRKV
ncbi:type II toxin-antitoxin system VapC family toxin [Candidatus Pyrohabitans sp.]